MNKDENNEVQELMRIHKQLFGAAVRRQSPMAEHESLEQPYVGEIVQTVTTYSVYETPVISVPPK